MVGGAVEFAKGKNLLVEQVTEQNGNEAGGGEEALWEDDGDEGEEDRLSLALVESPEKRFGPWMKASPWKPNTRSNHPITSKVGAEGARRKIFFSKSVENNKKHAEDTSVVNNVVSLLNEATITTNVDR
ncbi:unnamed protein product [Amaranthus hypochondriacus]